MKNKIYMYSLIVAFICCIGHIHAQTSCPAPTGLSSSNITTNSATVSWIAVSNNAIYNIRYRTSANSAWQTQTSQLPNKTLINLLALTTYEWQVQTGCPGLNGIITLSSFSASAYFTTLGINTGCPVPTGLFANKITTTSAKLHWASTGVSVYKLRYRQVNSATWTIKTPTTNAKNIIGLNQATAYEWQVRSKCVSPNGVITWSAWSNIAVFQTLGATTCLAPTALTSSIQSSNNGVLLSWNTTGAISYNIRYRSANTLAWLTTTSTTNSKLLTGLSSASSYEWQVQSVCGNGSVVVSSWSASAYFSTNALLSLSPNPAGNKISISHELRSEQNVTLTIRDFYGIPYATEKRGGMDGINQYELNVDHLKNGMYYLEVSSNQGIQTLKFYVQH